MRNQDLYFERKKDSEVNSSKKDILKLILAEQKGNKLLNYEESELDTG